MNAFKVFLSHRYKSPKTNLFFSDLFAGRVEVQFEVDVGISLKKVVDGQIVVVEKLPTNVTRLERMVRGADAFVGIYPLPGSPAAALPPAEMLKESQYFRLELDLAIRSGKPALVYYDQRYGRILECPANFFASTFDAQEIEANCAAPSATALQKTFEDFCQSVEKSMAYRTTRGAPARSSKVGLLLPPANGAGLGYDTEHIAAIESVLAEANHEAVRLRWPPVLDREFLVKTQTLDWIIVEVGDDPDLAAAVAFLHGRFVPALRLRQVGPAAAEKSALERILYGGIEVGYPKDTVRWRTTADLTEQVRDRVEVIDIPPRRISSRQQANEYFAEAALRKENVFLSYSGKDAAVAAKISAALKKRFQKVFDYKDGESIRPGEPWLKEIFEQLSESAVALPLLSKAYLESGNCEHEAQKIVERYDSKKLRMIPIRLEADVKPPSWLTQLQFEKVFSFDQNAEALAQRIVDLIK